MSNGQVIQFFMIVVLSFFFFDAWRRWLPAGQPWRRTIIGVAGVLCVLVLGVASVWVGPWVMLAMPAFWGAARLRELQRLRAGKP